MLHKTMIAKDFKAIAKIVNHNWIEERYIEKDDFLKDLCDYFKTTTAKFDKEKFLKECGVEE